MIRKFVICVLISFSFSHICGATEPAVSNEQDNVGNNEAVRKEKARLEMEARQLREAKEYADAFDDMMKDAASQNQ